MDNPEHDDVIAAFIRQLNTPSAYPQALDRCSVEDCSADAEEFRTFRCFLGPEVAIISRCHLCGYHARMMERAR